MLISNGIPYFGVGNGKLPNTTLTFALPSGYTCPGALLCLAKADRLTGHITDGPKQVFRCHEASIECHRPTARKSRWRNYELIRYLDASPMADLLMAGISAARMYQTTHLRWFTGGDCFSPLLRDAIIRCSSATPELIHYLYTKNLYIWVEDTENPAGLMMLPPNLRVTASWGGKFDHLLEAGIFPRTSRVLNTEEEAAALDLKIDYDDRLAWQDTPTHFCHLSHGTQRPGSEAGNAIRARRKAGQFSGYGRGGHGHQ
jgi:hypothetical protein